MPKHNEYAIYKGETFIFIGSSEECANFLGVKKKTIYRKSERTKNNTYKKTKISVVVIED